MKYTWMNESCPLELYAIKAMEEIMAENNWKCSDIGAAVGMTGSGINSILKGKTKITLRFIFCLSESLEIPHTYFIPR
jgi:antitoxin component HigA of HigAB toxin-antitoxin module